MAKRNEATQDAARQDVRAIKQRIIDGIAAGYQVIDAVQEAGIGWRRAYVWRAEDAEFREAWDRARQQAMDAAPAAPLSVPRQGGPRTWRVTIPPTPFDHDEHEYDADEVRPGDRIVTICWSYSRVKPDRILTSTVQEDGSFLHDDMADVAAYEALKPKESERPIYLQRRYVFVGGEGTTLRPRGEKAQAGDRILAVNRGYAHKPREKPSLGVDMVRGDGIEVQLFCDAQKLFAAAEAADQSVYGEDI